MLALQVLAYSSDLLYLSLPPHPFTVAYKIGFLCALPRRFGAPPFRLSGTSPDQLCHNCDLSGEEQLDAYSSCLVPTRALLALALLARPSFELTPQSSKWMVLVEPPVLLL